MVTYTANMIQELLKDKRVKVETQVYGGSAATTYTVLYWGTYKGTGELMGKRLLILEDAGHYNKAGTTWGEGDNKTSMIKSKMEFISIDDILSIGLE